MALTLTGAINPEELLRRRPPPVEQEVAQGLGPGFAPAGSEISLLNEVNPAELRQAPDISNRDTLGRDQRIPMKLPPRQDLKKQIDANVQGAQRAFDEGAKERGAFSAGQSQRFKERGVMLGGQEVAAQEFKNAMRVQNDAIEQLGEISGIRDQVQLGKFKQELRAKLTAARIELMKKTAAVKKMLAEQGASQQKKRDMYNMIGQIAGGAAGGYIATSGRKKSSSPGVAGEGPTPQSTGNFSPDGSDGM